MASLECRSKFYRVVFRFGGRKFQHALKTGDLKVAQGALARLEENLQLIERGLLEVPSDADLPTFLVTNRRLVGKPRLPEAFTLK